VALVVAAFLVYNAMSMAINQRRPVISILRALGGRRPLIERDLLAEAAVLGLIGGIIGAVLGIFMGRWAIGRLPAALVQSIQTRTEYMLPPYAIPAALVACVVACVAASAMAAWQVRKVSPIESLAPIGAAGGDTAPMPLRLIVGAGSLALFGVAFALASVDLGKLSIAAVALSFTAGLGLAFALIGPIVRAAAAVSRVLGSSGALGATAIERAPRRVWATLMAVVAGVATTVAITGSNANALDSTVGSFASVEQTDVWVASTAPGLFPTSPLLPGGLQATIAALPGVAGVVPGQMAYATVGDSKVLIQGLAAGTHQALFAAMSDDVRTQLLAGRGVVLSKDIARKLGLSVGDTISLPTPAGPQNLRVLELPPYFSGLTGTVGVSLTQMHQWFGRPGATSLEVMAAPGADRGRLLAAVRATTPKEFYVYSGKAGLDSVSESFKQGTALIAGLGWIVVFVAAVALLNTLMLSVLERKREIGVLRAIGSSRNGTLKMVLAEAVGIGVVGGVLGLATGAANQFLITRAFSRVIGLDVHFRASPMMLAFGVSALALALLGSIPPAVRAARLNIVEAVSVE
jgi:putative ABC transport system permease protein